MEKSDLPDGTKQCKHCNGDRLIPMKEDPMYIRRCPVCKGDGYVDWITYAVGYVESKKLIAAWPAPTNSNVTKAKISVSDKGIKYFNEHNKKQ